MIKKQFKEFLKTMGYGEDVTDEMLDEMVGQMSKLLEFENVGNSINFKTGCLIQSLVLKNQLDVKQELEEQIRTGEATVKLPPLKFQLSKTCLNLNENNSCSIMVGWKKEDPTCNFKSNFAKCEIVQNSVDQGMKEWK